MALAALKEELDAWDAALEAYDSGDVPRALNIFKRIPDTSKIVMNLGLIYMNQENFTLAIEKFTKAIALDHYFAIAYFQRGVCQYKLKQLENALQDFHDAELMMRGNDVVYYRELGLPFELHADQVHLNHGLTLIQLGRHSEGVAYLSKSGAQENDDHELFTMPNSLLFRPPLSKRLFLQKFEQANGSDGDKFILPPISPHSPMSPPPLSSGPRSDSSSTYAPSESDHGSTTSPKKNSLDSEKRDHVSFPSDSSSSSTAPIHLRTDLIKVMGYDLIAPTTEISTIPCAGVRIASGKLTGLMCWRLIVELLDDDEQGLDGHHRRTSWNWKQKGKGKIREYLKKPSVVANFILDTGCSKSVVSQEMLKALGFHGNYSAGSEVNNLRIQGIQTPCVVARLGEASRLGGQFMTSGNLTFYFDTKLNAPVLYVGDEANERPALDTIPRTVTDNDDGLARNRRKSLKQSVSSLMSALHLLKVGA